MRKSNKRLIISTEAVNSYGFRFLTSGIDLSRYLNNPVLLYNHQRPAGNSKDQILPIGFMTDLQVNGTELSGIPNFDDTDDFAMKIYNKVENGTLKMCSAGLLPLESSGDASVMVAGQTLPTYTKSVLLEVSILDIGSNPDSLAVALYDNAGHMITLSAKTASVVLSALNVPAKGSRDITITEHNPATLAIVKNAVSVGKFSESEAAELLKNKSDKDGIEIILKAVKRAKINPDRVAGTMPAAFIPYLNNSFDEIDENHKIPFRISTVRQHAPELYKSKFFDKHGRLPAESNGKPL